MTTYEQDLKELLELMKTQSGNYDYDLVEKAFFYAVDAHKGQKRTSGEEYYTHPLSENNFVISSLVASVSSTTS